MNLTDTVRYVGPSVARFANVQDLITHPANNTIRRCRVGQVLDERENLKKSILEEGLNEAIKCFANSVYIVGGNTRYETLTELGVKTIPVQEIPRPEELIALYGEQGEIDPMHPIVLSKLRADNTRVTVPVIDRYLQAQEGIVRETQTWGERTVARKKEIMRESNIAVKTFGMLNDLENGYFDKKTKKNVDPRPDLFQELLDYKEGKDVAGQHRAQYQDFIEKVDPSKKTYDKMPLIDELLGEFPWNLLRCDLSFDIRMMHDFDWFKNCKEKNFKGAMVHHMLAYSFTELWNSELDTDIKAVAVDNQSRYDIHFVWDGKIINTMEIKTTMGTTWSTLSKKYGYILLYKFSVEMNRAAIITSWLDKEWRNSNNKELWKAAGQGAVLDAKDLYEYGQYKIELGDMYLENDSVKVSTSPLDSMSSL